MNDVIVRIITPEERVAVAECFRTAPEWRRDYSLEDTLYVLRRSVESLAIEVPAGAGPRWMFVHYMEGCKEPLFVQYAGEDGVVYEASRLAVSNAGAA